MLTYSLALRKFRKFIKYFMDILIKEKCNNIKIQRKSKNTDEKHFHTLDFYTLTKQSLCIFIETGY